MVDERKFYEGIGDVLTQAQADAMRAIPLGRGSAGAQITLVDLLTAIVLERDILHQLVGARGLSPAVGALRERRNPPHPANYPSGDPMVQYAVALPGGEVELSGPLRAALDAQSRTRCNTRRDHRPGVRRNCLRARTETDGQRGNAQQHAGSGQSHRPALGDPGRPPRTLSCIRR